MTTQRPQPEPSRTAAIDRRTFLRGSGTLAAALAGTTSLLSARRAWGLRGSSGVVVLGLVGCGRRGTQLLRAALDKPGVVFSTVCDVDYTRGGAAVELAAKLCGSRPALTPDYRDVLDDQQTDAVIIATPDHWHMIPFMSACAAEKDIYIEVPLAPTMLEAAAMAYATRKYKRVVQVGLQQRSARVFAEARGIIRSGTMGTIAQTRTWSFARQSPMTREQDGSAPATLDYDRWLGPAPQRAYNAARVQHPEHFWDYGGGEATLWNMQLQDLVNTAMRVTVPVSVVAVGGSNALDDGRETPDTLEAVFEYVVPNAKFTQIYSLRLNNAYAGWGPAALPPLAEQPGAMPLDLPGRSGVQFFGSEKTLFVSGKRLVILPAEAESPMEDLQFLGIGTSRPASTQPAANSPAVDPLTAAHVQQFIDCVRSRKEPSATIEMGEVTQFPCVAANIAYRVGRRLYIEPNKREFYQDPEFKRPDTQANQMRLRQFRAPYVGPDV